MVVEDGRAAGEHQLGETRPRRRVFRVGIDPGPDRVELDEPFEERCLLRPGTREGLVQVMVRVDEAGRDDCATEARALLRVGRVARADLDHEAVLDQDPAVRVLGSGVVDGEDVRVGEQGLHACVPYL